MTFGVPGYLFLFLLAVPMVLFHMVRARRRKVVVPSTFLWKLASRDVATTRSFRRFLPSLLLLLQLLTLCCVTLALARPMSSALGTGSGLTVIVLDASASMQATDVAGGRHLAAVNLAEPSMPRRSAFTVIRAAGEPEVLARGVDRRAALRALRGAKPHWGQGDLAAAIDLGSGLLAGRRDRLLVLTDDPNLRLGDSKPIGADSAVPSPSLGSRVVVIAVTPTGGNVGVTSLETRPDPAAVGSHRWLAVIRNYSDVEARVSVALDVDGSRVYANEVVLPAGSSVTLPRGPSEAGATIRLGTAPSPAEATLSLRTMGKRTQNYLAVDDVMRCVVRPKGQVRVAVVRAAGRTSESPLLAALALIPGCRISVHGRTSAPPAGGADLTIFDGFSPTQPAPGKAVIIGALPSFLSSTARVPRTASESTRSLALEAIDWDKTHFLLRFVDLTGMAFAGVLAHAALPGARVVAESQAGPLIEELTTRQGRTLVMAFRPEASDLVTESAFPILVANLVAWASQVEGPLGTQAMAVGDVIDLRLATSTGAGDLAVGLIGPDGRHLPAPSLWLLVAPGFYRAKIGDTETPVAVNFASEAEADIEHPQAALSQILRTAALPTSTSRSTGGKPASATRAPSEVWRALALLGTLLLALEWVGFAAGRLGKGSVLLALLGAVRGLRGLRPRSRTSRPGRGAGL